jgi:hypothetical protein
MPKKPALQPSSDTQPAKPAAAPNLFVSWSGKRSGDAAVAFAKWIPEVIPDVRPWLSKHNIAAGAPWQHELTANLTTCPYGIFMVTKDNLHAPWLNYEAGSIARKLGIDTRLMVILLDDHRVTGPLEAFQATRLDDEEMEKLVLDMNNVLGKPDWAGTVKIVFKEKWPSLATALRRASSGQDLTTIEPTDPGTELLRRIAGVERQLATLIDAVQKQTATNVTAPSDGTDIAEFETTLARDAFFTGARLAKNKGRIPVIRIHKGANAALSTTVCGKSTAGSLFVAIDGHSLRRIETSTRHALCLTCTMGTPLEGVS